MENNQAYIFLLFILNGICIGIFFDIFRILRRSFKTSDFITYIEDIIFWILSGLTTLYFIFAFNNGEIRLYIFLGIILGISIYILSVSKYFIRINVKIINAIKDTLTKILTIILYPIKKITKIIFFRPVSFIFINVKKFYIQNITKIFNKFVKKQI